MMKLLVTKVFLWRHSLIRVLALVLDWVKSLAVAPAYSMESALGNHSTVKASLQDQRCVRVSSIGINTRTLSWVSQPSQKIPKEFQCPIAQGNKIINIEVLQVIAATLQVLMVHSVLLKTLWLQSNFMKESTTKAQEQRIGIRNSEIIIPIV